MVVLIVNRTERVYDFSYENLHFISRNVKPTRKSRSSPSPSPLRLSFSLISTFFCRSSGGFYRLPSPPLSLLYNTQERSRNSLKIILRNDNRILHASKKKKRVEYIRRINSCRGYCYICKKNLSRVSFSFRIIYSLTL